MQLNLQNRTKSTTRRLTCYYVSGLMILCSSLLGEPATNLNSGKLQSIENYINLDRHPEDGKSLAVIEGIAPQNSHLYLMEIAANPRNSERIRIRALSLLRNYSDQSDVMVFLEKSIQTQSWRANLRRWAVLSYARGFQVKFPGRVSVFLRSQESKTTGRLQKTISKTLRGVEKGDAH